MSAAFKAPIQQVIVNMFTPTFIKPIGSFVLSELATHRLVLSPDTGIAETGIPRVKVVEPTSLARCLWKFVLRKPPMCPNRHLAWHDKVNRTQNLYAMCSALVPSALTSMLMSKSYHIKEVPKLSLLVEHKVESYKKATEFREPCIIYNEDNGVIKTFRNIPGIVLLNVSKLLLMGLGEISAFGLTSNYSLHMYKMINTDVNRILKSPESQRAL
ncbi:hypothetical protein A6R68_00036, partial [Neotoma lepida]